MGGFRNEQHRITHRKRVFLFISYEAHDANAARHQPAMPNTWYLVSSGNRWPAIPHTAEQPAEELEAQLTAWLEDHVFKQAAPTVPR